MEGFQFELELNLGECRCKDQSLQHICGHSLLCEGGCGAVGTCSSGTYDGKASRGRCRAVAGLYVFWDAAVGGQLMAEGRAELGELLLGLRGGQELVGRG